MLKLYYSPGACAVASHIGLEEAGADYVIEKIDLRAGQQRTPEYLAINPAGRVPTLLMDGQALTESAAIVMYLADLHPEAAILVHPESPAEVTALADVVGSTTQLIAAVGRLPTHTFIVATDLGILHDMRLRYPSKTFLAAPTAGTGGSCKSCAFCPWMAMNSLHGVEQALLHRQGVIELDAALGLAARKPIQRMLDFAAAQRQRVQASGDMVQDTALFQNFGPA